MASRVRFNNVALAIQVMEGKDPQGVINHIMEVTKADRPIRISRAFDAVRTRILKNDKYRSMEGMKELWRLHDEVARDPEDRSRLASIIKSPISRIRWAQSQRKNLFTTPELQQAFGEVKIVVDPFYEFKAPAEVSMMVGEDKKRKIEENHSHQTKPVEEYHFTDEEIDAMIETAKEWCMDTVRDYSQRCNSLKILECVGLLTGRRKWEICTSLQIKSVPESEYQAQIRGIGKQLFESGWATIPLLAPLHVVVAGISRARRYQHTQGDYSGKRLFPKLTHTRYRDIYCKRAWEQRDMNKFHPTSCSELWWKCQALRNEMEQFTNHYTTLVIDRNEPEPDQQQPECKKPRVEVEFGVAAVANPDGGSSEHEFQDLI